MNAFASLRRSGQLARLRRVGEQALASYGLADAPLRLQRHEHNTTFRVDARGGPFLLRINRPGMHTRDTIASEIAWLGALRRDTDLGVPDPVAARDGSFVVAARPLPEEHATHLEALCLLRRMQPLVCGRPTCYERCL